MPIPDKKPRNASLACAAIFAASVVFGACSSDNEADDTSPGASGGTAGSAGVGGSGGTGGSGATSGDASVDGSSASAGSSGSDAGPDVSEDASTDAGDCVHTGPPVIDPGLFPVCNLCENAHCIPSVLLPASQKDLLADCDSTSKCVPDLFVETGGNFLLASCRSVADAEGRCVSTCLPSVQEQEASLPQDSCVDGERCVPCFDPFTGNDTGVCSISCDTGPKEPPVLLSTCCDGIGTCIPSDLIPSEQQSLLGQDTCADPSMLCAPNELLDPSAKLDPCRSVSDLEGRCVPACLPDVQAMKDMIPQDVCEDTHLCVPCYDPFSGAATGVCELNGDSPVEPPETFDVCCDGVGVCVPSSLVPSGQQSLLGQDSCEDPADLCAPTELLDPLAIPDACRSVNDAEGRCLPACLPDVEAMKDMLPQDSCASTHLCVPCYDPITSDATGACELNGDAPVEPPAPFDACCDGIGLCLPSSLIPSGQQSLLGSDTCQDASQLCLPTELLNASYVPDSCRSIGEGEGRCLPACLPAIQAQASLLPQDTCADTHLCAPCFDPFTGSATGTCEINGDAPVEPAYTFPQCCPTNGTDRGTCVPESLIPPGQASSLEQQSCEPDWLCAPTQKALDPNFKFPACSAGLFGAGACLPSCFVTSYAFLFSQGSCQPGERCVACSVFGSSTGACD